MRCPLLAQSGHAQCTAHVRYWGKSGHDVLRCTCLLMTQSDPSRWMATFVMAGVMVDGDGRLVGDRFGDF